MRCCRSLCAHFSKLIEPVSTYDPGPRYTLSFLVVHIVHPLQAQPLPLVARLPCVQQLALLSVCVLPHSPRVDWFDGMRQLLIHELNECAFGG